MAVSNEVTETPRSLIDEETKLSGNENLILMDDDHELSTSVIQISKNDNNQGLATLSNGHEDEAQQQRENSLIDNEWIEVNVVTREDKNQVKK